MTFQVPYLLFETYYMTSLDTTKHCIKQTRHNVAKCFWIKQVAWYYTYICLYRRTVTWHAWFKAMKLNWTNRKQHVIKRFELVTWEWVNVDPIDSLQGAFMCSNLCRKSSLLQHLNWIQNKTPSERSYDGCENMKEIQNQLVTKCSMQLHLENLKTPWKLWCQLVKSDKSQSHMKTYKSHCEYSIDEKTRSLPRGPMLCENMKESEHQLVTKC